jgi:hypothetical protein
VIVQDRAEWVVSGGDRSRAATPVRRFETRGR